MKTNLGLVVITCLLITLSFKPALAQNVLTIIEKDQDEKYLKNRDNKTLSDPSKVNKYFIDNNIVDINSTLIISINKQELVKQLGAEKKIGLTTQTEKLIDILNEVLKKQETQLIAAKAAHDAFKEDNISKVDFLARISGVASYYTDIFKADPRTEELVARLPGFDINTRFLQGVDIRLKEVYSQVASENKDTKLQFGGWILRGNQIVPIHINGFDNIPEQEYYTVQRWNIAPTEAQLAELKAAQALAKKNKDEGISLLKDMLHKEVMTTIDGLSSVISADITTIESEIAILGGVGNAIKQKTEDFVTQCNGVKSDAEDIVARYKNSANGNGLSDLIPALIKDIDNLKAKVSLLKASALSIVNDINALAPAVRTSAAKLTAALSKYRDLAVALFDSSGLKRIFEGYKFDVSVLEFTDKVLKFSLDELPSIVQLDLGTTGVRKSGDKIILKISTIDDHQRRANIETREIYMFQIAPHFESTVGLIFANPNGTTAIKNNFQMAPYFNLLLKGIWGSDHYRKRISRNTIWTYNLGLHVSTPDFDKDDIPELGVGGVLSLFNDNLQAGYAHNIYKNIGYFFFGFRIPIPSLNLGGGAQQR
ncbi:MAG: hypothetical protein EOO90_13215 [Pedobacter sp.]|nr:MAG: hypothetical protein EOO90_13215 [Pedobacter sp.]